MSRALITESYLTGIANAIRAKLGVQDTYTPPQMAAAIESIPTGGITPTGTKNITQNGTHDVTQYANANVNVPNSYAAGDEGKVVSNGELVAQTARSAEITENGTYDTTENNSVTVNVSGGGGASPWNNNILCNWDFENIVNTRGSASYTSGYGYYGWNVYQGTVRAVTGGITLVKDSSKSFMLSGQFLLQGEAVQALLGKTLTVSALVNDSFGAQTITITSSTGNQGSVLTVNGIRFYMYRDSSTQMPLYMYSDYEDTSRIVRAVKVEFGSTQTLAHQENGVWVLNRSQSQDEEYFRVRAMVKNS